jgi:glycosyltransferase involved in cell wall biosynthesis
MKTCGISFIVRVKNEEKNLEECVRSLFALTIPHEINIILNCCTDGSEEIAKKLAEENKNINIFTYTKKLSRAGYELLATDVDSEHSFVYYSNFCFKTGTYPWSFRWDADFIASTELLNFLNSKDWIYEKAYYMITYKSTDISSSEIYLSCVTISYVKYMCWETICYLEGSTRIILDNDIFINHKSELSIVKPYWYDEPWYLTEDSDEARVVKKRIEQLTDDFGKEPIGMARAMNPDCDFIVRNIMDKKPPYINFYY